LRRWCAGLIAGVIGYSFLFAVALCGQYSLDDREQTASWLAARSRSILRGGESATKSKKILVASGPFVDYDGLRPFIRSHGLDFRHFKPSVDAIRATSADFIVVSIPYVEAIRRRPRTPGAEALRRLDDAELGFRLSREIRPMYFGSAFYGRLDPGVVANWVHGQIGFRIYERDTTALGPRDPGPPLSSPKRVPEGVPGDAERGGL